MIDGFFKVCADAPQIEVADVYQNAQNIYFSAKKAVQAGVKLLVLPELCLTGVSCGDLFFQPTLQNKAKDALSAIQQRTKSFDMLIVLGLPLAVMGKLFDCSVLLYKGKILGVVPKTNVNANGFNRWFCTPCEETYDINLNGQMVSFGTHLLFTCTNMPEVSVAIEIGEDSELLPSLSTYQAKMGATVIANPCGAKTLATDMDDSHMKRCSLSKNLLVGYVYSNANCGESTTDGVYGGEGGIYDGGELLCTKSTFANEGAVGEIDVQYLIAKRAKNPAFAPTTGNGFFNVYFEMKQEPCVLTRKISQTPFENVANVDSLAENALTIASEGLKKRILHTNAKTVFVGLSGGLDSTLALLICVRAFDSLKKDRKDIFAVTMPCFGTTVRTRTNADTLASKLGVSLQCVDIKNAVSVHFNDISQEENTFDATYENAQARERTQVLMDMAGKAGGFVVGTGDMSELVLGWATFNGDHMSMYGVNAGMPKTFVRTLVQYEAKRQGDKELQKTLLDVLATPVSPELLPTNSQGEQAQKTEDLVGSYLLHDFFIYNALRNEFSPKKVYRLACIAFKGQFDNEEILKWLKVFYKRFFAQQFKRNCCPDGVAVFDFSLSPRSGFVMPSDGVGKLWQEQLDEIKLK